MKILIPHLHYTITVKQPPKGKNKFRAWVVDDGFDGCTLYMRTPIKKHEVSTLAHEIVHILQFMARQRNIDITEEKEHTGYLMQYIMNRILGYTYC